jgi:DNA-binding transcriptional ArsR family regulator
MADLLPSTPDTSAAEEPSPRVIGLDSDDADELLSALSSDTARRLLSALHEEPSSPSALADRADTSLQNVQYHLGNLDDAGLIEVVDTIYSEKGREMKVYAPADRPLVVFAGGEEESSGLQSVLTSLLSGFAVLGLLSLLVQVWLGDGLPFVAQSGGGDGGASTMTAMETTQQTAGAAAGLPPGLLFFLGGAAVLAVGFAVWFVRRRTA